MFNYMTPSSTISTSASSNVRTASCCISSIVRRILCFNILTTSTRALDQCLLYEDQITDKPIGHKPGIVAKLMGLESLPITNKSIEQSPSSLDSCNKSRSSRQVKNNRKIIPIFYKELEDENFFILSFEKGCDHQRRERRRRMRNRRKMRRERLHEMDKENLGVISENNVLKDDEIRAKNANDRYSPMRDSCDHQIIKEKNKEIKTMTTFRNIEDDVENSSPNSVLDVLEFPDDQERDSSGTVSTLENSKTRRTLSEELENYTKSKQEKVSNANSSDHEDEGEKHHRFKKCDEIGKLAASEILKSSWIKDEISKNDHYNYFKEISRDLSLEILDELISEEVVTNFE